jgi:hypothetical protein
VGLSSSSTIDPNVIGCPQYQGSPKLCRFFAISRESWKVLGIEALDLFDARAGILGKVEDVDLAVREDDPHSDRGVT